jgi:serine/threonine protein kinase
MTEAAIEPTRLLCLLGDGVSNRCQSQEETQSAVEASQDTPCDPPSLFTELHAGTRFGAGGRFELVRLLGSGGTGLVFLTRDLLLDRLVAAKFARPDGDLPWDYVAARFATEGRITARMNHENIVHVFDVGVWHQHPYLVLEYLEGSPLSEQLAAHRLSPRRATQIMVEIARALDHAHHAGILHLDLKPHNVFVLDTGHVKLLDFGISALCSVPGDAQAEAPIGHALPVGTPSYMAPEQWRMAALDERTDIWAAGVVYYEMLRGSAPFAAVDPTRLCASILSGLVVPPSSSRFGMPRIGERLIASMLSRDPAQRPGSAVELLLGLDSVQHAMRQLPLQMVTRPAQVFAASIMRVWWRLRLAFLWPSNTGCIGPGGSGTYPLIELA